MKWRCDWCGKPHERNDPPCDNCGHHSFEKAVVPTVSDGGSDGPIEWICAACGRSHPRNSPPCSRCGHTTLEKREGPNAQGGVDPLAEADDARGDGPGGDEMTVWVCTACDREHPRHNPPCSRCGNMDLERRVESFEDLEPAGGGWLDALDLQHALGFAGAFLFLGLILASTLGVLNLGIGGPLPVEDVPGEGDTVAGLSLGDVERAYVAELNERRAAAGESTLERSDRLDEIAAYNNKRYVKATHGEGSMPSEDDLEDATEDVEECTYTIHYVNYRVGFADRPEDSVGEFATESALAAALLDEYATRYGFLDETNGFVGVDVHVGPDGQVFVTQVVC